MLFKIFRSLIQLLMHVVMLILNQKTNYLMAPDAVIPALRVERMIRLWHFFPSVIIAILIVVKVFPHFSSYYTIELENNSVIIPISFFFVFLVVLMGNGIVIEKILERSDLPYAEYKKSLLNE